MEAPRGRRERALLADSQDEAEMPDLEVHARLRRESTLMNISHRCVEFKEIVLREDRR
jgi:hypothetical protein